MIGGGLPHWHGPSLKGEDVYRYEQNTGVLRYAQNDRQQQQQIPPLRYGMEMQKARRFPPGMTIKTTAKATADSSAALRNGNAKKQTQIPFGNDKQKFKYNGNDESNCKDEIRGSLHSAAR